MQCVENCGPLDDPTTRVYFEQPVWQTLQMFVGEVGCKSSYILRGSESRSLDSFRLGFLPVLYTYLKNKRNPAPMLADDEPEEVDHVKGLELKGWKVLLFFLPAACDLTGTTVSTSSTNRTSRKCIVTKVFSTVLAYERRTTVHSRVDLPWVKI